MTTVENNQISKIRLLLTALIKFGVSILTVAALLFISAGSLDYRNAWIFLGTLSSCMTVTLIYLFIKDPLLLQKRLQTNEKEREQKIYVKLTLFFFFTGFLLPGFDYRFKFSDVPQTIVYTGVVFMIIGYVLFINVLKQNSYASRVIEIQDKQKLIDTGLYGIVRHPMYFSISIIYIVSPLVLGSYYGLIPMTLLVASLVYRIKNEEKVLLSGLLGYKEYTERVRYRLIPFIW